MQHNQNVRNGLLIGFILVKFFIQYQLFSGAYELHRDEFLHLDQANHLAWGYLSVPPVTSWLSCIIQLLGNGFFWIKFFPTLFGALTMVVVWKTVEQLNGGLFALVLSAVCVTFSVLFRLNALYQPNSLDVLCWTASYYFILKYLASERPKWLYFFALTFAFGFLNKYNIIFMLAGVFLSLLLTKDRKIFLNGHLYAAALLGLLIISPNLYWQHTHGYPVFIHLRELADTQLVNVRISNFIGAQLLFFPGSILLVFLGLYALATDRKYLPYRSLCWSFLITIGIFLLLKAKDYYAIGIYPIYFAFGAVAISHLVAAPSKRMIKAGILLLPMLFFLPMYLYAFPNKSPQYVVKKHHIYHMLGLLRWEDGEEHPIPQDFADMLGWRELARKVDSVYDEFPDKKHTLVLCDNYGQAGAINYYSQHGIQAVSFNADYVNWFDLAPAYHHLIRVKNNADQGKEYALTSAFFKESTKADSIGNRYAREYGTTIYSFRDATIDINARLLSELLATPGYLKKQR